MLPIDPQRQPTIETPPWPHRVGILNDYLRIPFANGSTFASRFLYHELKARGHQVTVIGPRDPAARDSDLPEHRVALASLPLRSHPGVHIPMPTQPGLSRMAQAGFDLLLGQTSSALMCAGLWLQQTHGVPLLMVNTFHLPRVYHTLLPPNLIGSDAVHAMFRRWLLPWVQQETVRAYNASDGLVVLCPGLRDYWRDLGVEVPIHVIARAIDLSVFGAAPKSDPFPATATRGGRLLVVCRHAREKSLDRLLDIFAARIAPQVPHASLTMIGDGPEHEALARRARELNVADRVHLLGEQPQHDLSTWYAHADLFVYTSLSETYGQVVTEALWCGLPVVAFADGRGVSGQIAPGIDGELIEPGPNTELANDTFAHAANRLLQDPDRLRRYGDEARQRARQRADTSASLARYKEAFHVTREHRVRTGLATSARNTDGLEHLSRWAGLHTMLATFGLLRAPATEHAISRDACTWMERRPSHPAMKQPARAGK